MQTDRHLRCEEESVGHKWALVTLGLSSGLAVVVSLAASGSDLRVYIGHSETD